MQQGFIKRQQQPPPSSRLEKRESLLLTHQPSFSDELLALRHSSDTFISLLPLDTMRMVIEFLVSQLLADPNNECQNVRVVVIGDAGAGKSSLLERYANTHTPSPLTEVFLRYVISAGRLFKLFLVDTDAGMQRLRLLDKAQVCIVVTDKATFPSASGLLQSVPSEGRWPIKVLCCTKCDDPSLQAPTEAAERVAQKHGATLCQVSAKTGSGVNALFAAALERVQALHAEAAAEARAPGVASPLGCAVS